jgi:hypothetical protein
MTRPACAIPVREQLEETVRTSPSDSLRHKMASQALWMQQTQQGGNQ